MARVQRVGAAVAQSPRSEPLPGVVAVSAGGAAVPVGFVRVLVGVGVFLLHQGIVVSAVLGAGRQAVPALASPLVVEILVVGHEAAPLDGRVLRGVAAVPPALALRGPNKASVNTRPRGSPTAPALPQRGSSSHHHPVGLLGQHSPAAAAPGAGRLRFLEREARPAEYHIEHEK